MSNEMVIFSKNINKQSLVYPNMKDMPVLLIEGIFDGFELFPLDRAYLFVSHMIDFYFIGKAEYSGLSNTISLIVKSSKAS